MQFSSREDIDAPIGEVFAMLSDVDSFERSAIRRGIDVTRVGDRAAVGEGMAWTARFMMRGKPREAHVTLARFEAPQMMRFDTVSQGLEGHLTVDLVALSPRRTRLGVILNLKPNTLSARLLVQSLKLARGNLSKRFKLKVADYARHLEARGN
jgi:hypothetical protein